MRIVKTMELIKPRGSRVVKMTLMMMRMRMMMLKRVLPLIIMFTNRPRKMPKPVVITSIVVVC